MLNHVESGSLAQYFSGVAVKTLSAVEVDNKRSNQHEFNGSAALIRLFGRTSVKLSFDATFMYLTDEEEHIVDEGILTWYDARVKHPTRSEHRLYYSTNDVSRALQTGDTLFICRKVDDSCLVVATQSGSSIERQLFWLFGMEATHLENFQMKTSHDFGSSSLQLSSRLILDTLGIEAHDYTSDFLDDMLSRFGNTFPSTRDFSEYARNTTKDVDAYDDPDQALLLWTDREDQLFKTLEKHIISSRLEEGFVSEGEVDVDDFIQFSLSVQNRRKSRAGRSLENHVNMILKKNNLIFEEQGTTERRNRPDFLFPSSASYANSQFPAENLYMLACKTTCKDRWRQVLDEADRIMNKHLLTLEAAISINQTKSMHNVGLQLVVPKGLHNTFTEEQGSWLYSLSDFINMIRKAQKNCL